MGTNFSLIAIKHTPILDAESVFKQLQQTPFLKQENIDFFSVDDYIGDILYTERPNFFGVTIENNTLIFCVESIKNSFGDFTNLKNISKLLHSEILFVEHSDTACVSSVAIFKNGILNSWDFGGFEDEYQIPYNLPSMAGGEIIQGNGDIFYIITYFLEVDYYDFFEAKWNIYEGVNIV